MATIEKGSVVTEGDVISQGGSSGALLVTTPGYGSTGALVGAGPAAGPAFFSENDPGTVMGARYVASPETDDDFRLRIAQDNVLDQEHFTYTAQNTGKHSHVFTTTTATVSQNGLLINSGSDQVTAHGMTFGTFAEFPAGMTGQPLYCETNMSLSVASNSIPSGVALDVGMFRRAAAQPFAPTDGAYFRFSSAGISGVINNNGVETAVVLTNPNFAANDNHYYLVEINEKGVGFWIDNVRYGEIVTPLPNAQAFRSITLPWSVRWGSTGAVATVFQALITDYTVTLAGAQYSTPLSVLGNRSLGSHQGLSGQTMGALSSITANNQAVPAGGAGSNSTAAATGLGGIATITATTPAATDFIVTGFLNPAGSITAPGRRLVLTGVHVDGVNLGAAVATSATTVLVGLAYGSTAVSLATTETGSFVTATTKAPRREALGFMYWNVGAPIGATPTNGAVDVKFANPIYVNPGEAVDVYIKFVAGTATGSQTLTFAVVFDYGWE